MFQVPGEVAKVAALPYCVYPVGHSLPRNKAHRYWNEEHCEGNAPENPIHFPGQLRVTLEKAPLGLFVSVHLFPESFQFLFLRRSTCGEVVIQFREIPRRHVHVVTP
jgi:hypothetical protein